MFGFPKVFSTKEDYYNSKAEYPAETKAHLKKVMDGRFIWQKDHELSEGETGINDATHKVIMSASETGDMMNHQEVPVQMVLVEDMNSLFYRLGFTLDEANRFINS